MAEIISGAGPQRNDYLAVATAATTLVKTGKGYLVRLLVTGGSTGTIVIYDSVTAAGTKIADFDTTNAIAGYEFNCKFDTGLTIIASANVKFTVVYR